MLAVSEHTTTFNGQKRDPLINATPKSFNVMKAKLRQTVNEKVAMDQGPWYACELQVLRNMPKLTFQQ